MRSQSERAPVVEAVRQTFHLRGHSLDLYIAPGSLFVPNAVSRLFSKIVELEGADTVFDIGTGTGVLAIWAALHACREVYAIDPVQQHCELAVRNAHLHGVADKIRVRHGSLFDPLPVSLKADVIMGDVSGIADGPGKALGWYSPDVPTGGGDGTEVVVGLLRQSRDRLKPGGRLYFPLAIGLSDDDKIMSVAGACYGSLKRKVDVWFPLSDAEYEIVSCCLPSPMLAKVERRGSRMAWNGHIYEATEPR